MNMDFELIHHNNRSVECLYQGRQLFDYVYRPEVAQLESPKPYFHPLKTLKGNTITDFRPTDHPWHHGLAMTLTDVSGENFWGGVTYLQGEGYRQLPNNGAQRHSGWAAIHWPKMEETLQWVTEKGEKLLDERRWIAIDRIDPANSSWVLSIKTRLANFWDKTLEIGSPSTNGRPNAGYGGLFWRGPGSFNGGRLLLAGGEEGEENVMGKSSPWLAYFGSHDKTGDQTTLLFLDNPNNPRFPTKWFARNSYAALVSFAFMFDEVYQLAPGEELILAYQIVIADGHWTIAQIDDFINQIRLVGHAGAAVEIDY